MRQLIYPFSILRIAPSMRCNFKCKYCTHFDYQMDIREKTEWEEVPPETWIKHLRRLKPTRGWGGICVIIGVGENTLYEGLSRIINVLHCRTNLYTNASDTALPELREIVPRSGFCVYVSYHPASIEINNFIRNAKWIQERFNVLDFHAVPRPGIEGHLEEDKKIMAEHGIDLKINHPFTGWVGDKFYFYDNMGGNQPKFRNRFLGRNSKETKMVRCKVSANHVSANMSMSYPIAPNGDIYLCWRYFLAGSKDNILGNFFDEDFQYDDSFHNCSNYGDCNICSWDRNIVDVATGRQLDCDTIERIYV